MYGCVSQGLVTTKFVNLIGWNWYCKQALDWQCYAVKTLQAKCKTFYYFLLTIFICGSAKNLNEKKSKEDKQTLAELSSSCRHLEVKCPLDIVANKNNLIVKTTFDILKFSMADTNKGNWMIMFSHFFSLCPPDLTIKLNFSIQKCIKGDLLNCSCLP